GGIVSDDKKTWYPSDQSLKGSQTKDPGVLKNGKTIHDFDDIKNFLRPNMILLANCRQVLLEGVTFQNSPAWCIHPLLCEDLTVRGIYAKNPWYAQNGDGIDVESCRNVLLENSTFDVGDDGICIKSGRDEEGRKRGRPTENMIVRNCIVYHAHGGFVIGSEMSGGARNLYVYDCTFIGTDIGLRFKTTRGRGGIVEKIYIRNINMKDIAAEAILFDMYYAAKDPVPLSGEKREPPKVETWPVTEATPQFRDFHVSNVTCSGAETAIFIRGLPEMNIKDIWLDNMVLQAKEGIDCTEATGIHLDKIKLLTKNTDPLAHIHNSRDITLDKLSFGPDVQLLIEISGEKSAGITLRNTDAGSVKKKTSFTYGATEKAFVEK
ncbi:MAG: right-handed parallel beta-helix repeat-containing protein, partial [Bacteroidetes bacterium]|nr:right-handed parallel beta-helix repeat-containing protein [Bacteroidota bacterium]